MINDEFKELALQIAKSIDSIIDEKDQTKQNQRLTEVRNKLYSIANDQSAKERFKIYADKPEKEINLTIREKIKDQYPYLIRETGEKVELEWDHEAFEHIFKTKAEFKDNFCLLTLKQYEELLEMIYYQDVACEDLFSEPPEIQIKLD